MAEFEPRRAEPGQVFDFNEPDGIVRLRADDDGIVRPKNDAQARVADAFGLPVARAAEEKKAASAGKEG